MKVIAVANQKGGTGKTATAVNIAVGLVARGRRVLLVDADPQASATYSLGIAAHELSRTLYDAFLEDVPVSEVEILHGSGLKVLPASLDLAAADLKLAGIPGRDTLLRSALQGLAAAFDVAVIDTPPSLGLLSVNALAACTGVLVPVQVEYLALKGLNLLTETVATVRKRLNPEARIAGVVATRFDARRTLNRDAADLLKKTFGATMFKTIIRENIAIAEAPAAGKSIFDYAPSSHGAEDYGTLIEELIKREGI